MELTAENLRGIKNFICTRLAGVPEIGTILPSQYEFDSEAAYFNTVSPQNAQKPMDKSQLAFCMVISRTRAARAPRTGSEFLTCSTFCGRSAKASRRASTPATSSRKRSFLPKTGSTRPAPRLGGSSAISSPARSRARAFGRTCCRSRSASSAGSARPSTDQFMALGGISPYGRALHLSPAIFIMSDESVLYHSQSFCPKPLFHDR